MSSPLKNAWLVGDIGWRCGDIGQCVIARTKTAARQAAQHHLADAEAQWAKAEAQARREWWSHRPEMSLDEYADWIGQRSRVQSAATLPYEWYRVLRDGIWLTGPTGGRVHITEPSETARRCVARCERRFSAGLARMIGE